MTGKILLFVNKKKQKNLVNWLKYGKCDCNPTADNGAKPQWLYQPQPACPGTQAPLRLADVTAVERIAEPAQPGSESNRHQPDQQMQRWLCRENL
jgi:hypothetical protein